MGLIQLLLEVDKLRTALCLPECWGLEVEDDVLDFEVEDDILDIDLDSENGVMF